MNKEFQDFEDDFKLSYTAEDLEIVNKLIGEQLESDTGLYKTAGEWTADLSIEKHDALNHSYHISLSKDESDDEEISLTFYTGIDVGCELVEYSFCGNSILNTQKFEKVLDDLSVDWPRYKADVNKNKIQWFLDASKDSIMEIYNKQNYDNYVTGGGTSVTDASYKEQLDSYRNRGLHWICEYKEIEVDRNIL